MTIFVYTKKQKCLKLIKELKFDIKCKILLLFYSFIYILPLIQFKLNFAISLQKSLFIFIISPV